MCSWFALALYESQFFPILKENDGGYQSLLLFRVLFLTKKNSCWMLHKIAIFIFFATKKVLQKTCLDLIENKARV